jgi:hypothetical protein
VAADGWQGSTGAHAAAEPLVECAVAVAAAGIASIGNLIRFGSPYVIGLIQEQTHSMVAVAYLFTAANLISLLLCWPIGLRLQGHVATYER